MSRLRDIRQLADLNLLITCDVHRPPHEPMLDNAIRIGTGDSQRRTYSAANNRSAVFYVLAGQDERGTRFGSSEIELHGLRLFTRNHYAKNLRGCSIVIETSLGKQRTLSINNLSTKEHVDTQMVNSAFGARPLSDVAGHIINRPSMSPTAPADTYICSPPLLIMADESLSVEVTYLETLDTDRVWMDYIYLCLMGKALCDWC